MKRIIFTFILVLSSVWMAGGREFEVSGPQGGISMVITLPEGFDTASDSCPMVLLLHGTKDKIVPMRCSEEYAEAYGDRAELIRVDGENHMITRRRGEIVALTVAFFKKIFSGLN